MSGNRDPRNDNEKRLAQSRQDSPDRIDDLAETIDHTKPEQDSTIDLPNQTGLPTSFGRYVVREARGRGGFGAVYLGFDPELQRQVAIKVPHLAGASDAQVQEILQEARRLAALSHPGIVTVYDVGVQDGMCYIVSDYVDGMSLAEWLKRNQPRWQQAATIAAELAEALAHAHAFRTIHRDVKPGNIILKDNKTPVLVDFGLAISDPSSAALERGHVSGTPQFMSPEQAAGKGHRIDGRTDIYALGIVLYCMLCQRMPFESDSVTELLRQVREDEPQPPRQLAPEIPAELERICLKAISKHISDRYTTAADMALELRAVLEAHPDSVPAAPVTSPPPETSTKRLPSSVRRVRQAERRHVTVLYCECDFFNSAAFLENLDPEEQHELLGDYQQACDEVISRYGGTVVQSTGHGMLVCLGYPTAYEDSARRAVHSGLELIEAVERLNDRLASVQIQLTPWVGIHTGVVIAKLVTDGSSPEPMSLVGEARSVATQLKVAAAPLSVVITQSTQLLISGCLSICCCVRGNP
jgi:serine/threonine protein kinase